ncbi:GNAT family N-acetyltransferase [Brachybacterium paraconglomeratum]|uniref:GNAT family N-acetyltransferase n=1 Tax=Brachybacterium paraconglomeratum TaxID=173362 RepID=UPI0031E83F13
MSTWETHPVTEHRFDDFADVLNPTGRETHCWCLSHRLPAREIRELSGEGGRAEAMRCLTRREHAPGVVTYCDGVPVGWCSISPRSEIPLMVASKKYHPIDDVPVWSIICVVVRSGHRRQGVTGHLLDGAVQYAAEQGAPAIEAYPVDPPGRMDLTMAFVGTKAMFTRAGFVKVGVTDAVASRLPRLVMRRDLSSHTISART